MAGEHPIQDGNRIPKAERMNLTDPQRAEDELRRCLKTGNGEAVARTAMMNIWPLYSAHADLLTEVITSLPSSVLERYPMLRVLHPMTPVLARTHRSFRPLISTDDARTMSPEEVDFQVLTQMIAFRLSGDLPAALGYAKRLEDRILHTRVEARDRLDGPLWYLHLQIGSTLLAAGDSSRALLEFSTARQLGVYALQPDAERVALGRVALAHAVRGALGEAERALEQASRMPLPTSAHANASRTSESTAAALIAVDRVSDDVDDVLALLEPYDSVEFTWPFALLARTRALLSRQQPDDALEAIRLAAGTHPVFPGSFAADVITSASMAALIATGQLARARRVAEEAESSGVLTKLAMARLALHDAWYDEASHILGALSLDPALGPGQRAEWAILKAWLELGRAEDLSRETAMQLERIAVRRESRRLLSIMPRQLTEEVRGHLIGDTARDFDRVAGSMAMVEMLSRPALTSGELRVLNALRTHRSTASIAATFHVSPNTVKSQLRSLYRKLECSSRDEAIRTATRLRLLGAADIA